MIRRHDPNLPVNRDGEVVGMGKLIAFPGVQVNPELGHSTAFADPSAEWTMCPDCDEELMVGDICVWCEDEEED